MPFWVPKKAAPAIRPKRAGNEFLFQMQAMTNIEVMNAYNVKKIVTAVRIASTP